VHPNVSHLLKHSTADFVQLLGDDDWLHPTCFQHAEFLRQNSHCSACSGYFAAIPPSRDLELACFGDRFMRSDPIERSLDYVQYMLSEAGVNWLALAVHRRSTMSIYDEYINKHPFQFYFLDQMLSQIALLTGAVKGMRDGFQFYKNRRPEEMQVHIQNLVKSIEGMGLPPWLYEYYDYWLACEYATLYLYRGLSNACFSDRIADADRIFVRVFARFVNMYRQSARQYESHFERVGIQDAMHAVLDDPCALVGLRGMVHIYERLNPDAGRRYADFLRRELVLDVTS
jgi:hypothetical protein